MAIMSMSLMRSRASRAAAAIRPEPVENPGLGSPGELGRQQLGRSAAQCDLFARRLGQVEVEQLRQWQRPRERDHPARQIRHPRLDAFGHGAQIDPPALCRSQLGLVEQQLIGQQRRGVSLYSSYPASSSSAPSPNSSTFKPSRRASRAARRAPTPPMTMLTSALQVICTASSINAGS